MEQSPILLDSKATGPLLRRHCLLKLMAVTRRVETMSPSFVALLPPYPKGSPC